MLAPHTNNFASEPPAQTVTESHGKPEPGRLLQLHPNYELTTQLTEPALGCNQTTIKLIKNRLIASRPHSLSRSMGGKRLRRICIPDSSQWAQRPRIRRVASKARFLLETGSQGHKIDLLTNCHDPATCCIVPGASNTIQRPSLALLDSVNDRHYHAGSPLKRRSRKKHI